MTTPTLHPGYRWSTDYATMADLMEQGHVLLCQMPNRPLSAHYQLMAYALIEADRYWVRERGTGYYHEAERQAFIDSIASDAELRWMVPPGACTTDHPAPILPVCPDCKATMRKQIGGGVHWKCKCR